MPNPKTNRVIITCAITGGIHTPTLSDALPWTAEDLAAQSIAAAEALGLQPASPDEARTTLGLKGRGGVRL